MENHQHERKVLELKPTDIDGGVVTRWSQCLPLTQRDCNTSFNSSIGTSPARMLFGNQITRKINHGNNEPETKT